MAKRKIVWSPNAEIDLLKILEYFYIRNGSKTYSVHLNSKIRKTVKLLSNHPFLGLQSDIENVRSLVEGNCAILYKVDKETIRINAIWDCRQNPDNLTIPK
jgi:plasmid stabilization system protein ParE